MIIIAWNVVTKNFHATESLLDHLREKITELEPYLNDFPPDSVHLRIELARDLKTELYNGAGIAFANRHPAQPAIGQGSEASV